MSDLKTTDSIIDEIRRLLIAARAHVAVQVNTELLSTYWNIGRIIVEHEMENKDRAAYGKETLKLLSKELTKEFGKGFSVSNLQFMRRFYQTYQIQQTVSVNLSWSHYCELMTISNADKRGFYEKEAANSRWSVRELKRQIETSLFERLLLTEGKGNKETVISLAEKGIEPAEPLDMVKDPYVFEFLGVPENKPIIESDLEKALVSHIEKFLLELGRGFMYVGSQQRITVNNTHYYVDMVFYNKILHNENDSNDTPWDKNSKIESAEINGNVNIILSDRIYIDSSAISNKAKRQLRRMAAFSNKQYYQNLAMDMPNYDESRFIYLGADEGKYIVLPRGLLVGDNRQH